MKTLLFRKSDGKIVSIYDGSLELSPQMMEELDSVIVPSNLGDESNYNSYIEGARGVSTSTPTENLVFNYIKTYPLEYKSELNTYVSAKDTKVRTIGILRFIGIGDVLMTTQELIPSIRNTFPDDKITYVTSESGARLLVGNSDIDDVMVYEWKHGTSPIIEAPIDISKEFDVLINLVNRVDFLPIVLKNTRPKNFLDVAKGYLGEGIKHKKVVKPIFYPKETSSWIHGLSESCGLSEYIACTLSSHGEMKHYPIKKWSELATIMPDKTFVWTSDNPSYKTINLIDVKIPPNVINLSALLSFEQFLAIWGSAICCIGTDSGGMNLAGHMEIPFIGLMGSTKWTQHTSNYKEFYPVTTKPKLDCMPCIDWQLRSDCKGDSVPWCMDGIKPEQIKDTIDVALAQEGKKSFFGVARNYFK